MKNIQRWVGGKTQPPIEFLTRFCEVTDTSIEWLMMGRGQPDAPRPGELEWKLGEAEWRLKLVRDALATPYMPTAPGSTENADEALAVDATGEAAASEAKSSRS